MSDERNTRLVSGEIIPVSGEPVSPAARADDVIDAEFETLRPDPQERLAGTTLPGTIGSAGAPAQGLGSLRKSERQAEAVASRGGPIFWIVGLALIVGAFWVSGGHALVRQSAPATQSRPLQPAAAAHPLQITEVTSRIEERGGRRVLFIDGMIVNTGKDALTLPPVDIAVTTNDETVLRYRLGTSQDLLAAGRRTGFSSRLEAPKEGVKSVSVTFQE
jgi:hypothetical protein